MKTLIGFISDSFIWAVGITRPKPGHEKSAAIFISVALVGTLLAVTGAFFFLLHQF